jgi:tetratricopeptide (TPR) repeat protein
MSAHVVRKVALVLLMIGGSLHAASVRGDFQTGQNYYFAGRFKEAISQFGRLIEANPRDADSYLWLGKSYAMLADIKAPVFGTRARSRARVNLRKAVQLAPENVDYRHEYFEFLLDSDGSGSALREAETLVAATPASSLDHDLLRSRLQQERREHRSAESLANTFFLFGPQHAAGILP